MKNRSHGSSTSLTIGRLASRAGVNIETIRYYQRRGILATPRKPLGGVRRYSSDDLMRLQFIRRAQELGFTLREIAELLKLGDGSCQETRSLAERRLTDINSRIQDLKSMRATLGKLIRTCRDGNQPPCPIMSSLKSSTNRRSTSERYQSRLRTK